MPTTLVTVPKEIHMTTRFALLALSLVLVPPASAQVVETEDGRVQIIGLMRRTPQELERMIQEESPGTNLSSGACAAVLKFELGFPEAAVIWYGAPSVAGVPDSLETIPITLLLVVEPEDEDRVRYAPPPPDSLGPVEGWEERYEAYPMGRLSHSIWVHVGLPGRKPVPVPEGMPDSMRVLSQPGVAFLEARDTEADRQLALHVIENDRDWINRSIAAAVLTNFPDKDSTWWALAEVARGVGPHDYGKFEGIAALQALGNHVDRPVDWAPAAETLRAIFDGTSLFAVDPLMQVLAKTKISPELADEVLGDGRYVLAYLRSPNPAVRSQALGFLRQISGEDFGDDVNRWEEWIDALS
jgi:hypothetical protein